MLSRLIDSPELRKRLIENAQHKIRISWLLSQNTEPRIKIYSDLVKDYRPGKKTYPPFFELEKSLTRQLYDEHVRNYNYLQKLNSKLAEKEADILFLNDTATKQYELIQSLTSKVSDQDSLITTLTSKVSDQDSLITTLTSKVSDQENLINSLYAKITDKDNLINTINIKLFDQENQINALTGKVIDEDGLIQSLNDKLSDEGGINQSQHEQLQQLYQRTVDLENELLSYVTSRSWRLTRPLRRIFRKL